MGGFEGDFSKNFLILLPVLWYYRYRSKYKYSKRGEEIHHSPLAGVINLKTYLRRDSNGKADFSVFSGS